VGRSAKRDGGSGRGTWYGPYHLKGNSPENKRDTLFVRVIVFVVVFVIIIAQSSLSDLQRGATTTATCSLW
jgi:hypothetical protein